MDTLVVGRKTYDFVLSLLSSGQPWVYGGKRCIVMTHSGVRGQHGERAYAGEPAELMRQLEAEGARQVYVDGGVVIRSFLAAGLLDALTLMLVPCLLGEGLPLFGGVKLESELDLAGVQTLGGKLVQLRYRLRPG